MPKLKLKNVGPQGKIIFVSSLYKSKHSAYCEKNQEIPQKPHSLFKKNVSLYFSQYCDSTTIHGMKYVGQRGRYFIEKLIWTIIIAIMFTVCMFLIQQTYMKWRNSPVIVTFAATETPISEIPFPAITICPEAKFDSDWFSFTKTIIKIQNSIKLSTDEEDFFQASLLVCENVLEQLSSPRGVHSKHFIERDVFYKIFNVFLPFDPLNMTRFRWLDDELSYNAPTPIMTSEGPCYSFNMLSREEIFRVDNLFNYSSNPGEKCRKWSLEDGYPSGDNLDSYPRRTFVSGVQGGFAVDALFTNHSHLDGLCEQSLQGYKVVIHHPSEMPNMQNHFRVPLDKAVLVAVKPTMIMVSKELLDYEPEIRQCYFAREKYLSMYKLYTQENCLIECLANYTFARCKCVPFYMPMNEDTPICGPGSSVCVRDSKIKYLEITNSSDSGNHKCGCLPSCMSLSYNIETSQTDWYWQDMFDLLRILSLNTAAFPNTNGSHFSRLAVYYKDLQFLSARRKQMYSYIDLFSNVGGLLGLFIGFSVTSMIEILYFLFLRVICNIKKYGRDTWSGKPELINVE